MSRVKLLLDVADDLRNLSESIRTVCDAMTSDSQPKAETKTDEKPVKTEKAEKPDVTLKQVRGVLAEKSRDGFTVEVRNIIKRHGADRLSEVDPSQFAAVLKEAEALGNG